VATTHVVDLAWTPDGQRLLVVGAEERPDGGVRTRLWLLGLEAGLQPIPRELVLLPAQHVPGSILWSPDGQRVVFLARTATLRALCLIDLAREAVAEFRYLAELGEADFGAAAAPFPPVAWQADGRRLLFVAPAQDPPNGPFGWLDHRPRHVLYVVGADDLVPHPVGPVDASLAAWREDDSLALLGRLKDEDGPLVLRSADAGLGQTAHLLELPLRPPSGFAARWDLAHARLLIASPNGRDQLDYWLVRLGADEES
jgi:dipeptidyl aminopeptidase/acylaminoacyl peptidase